MLTARAAQMEHRDRNGLTKALIVVGDVPFSVEKAEAGIVGFDFTQRAF